MLTNPIGVGCRFTNLCDLHARLNNVLLMCCNVLLYMYTCIYICISICICIYVFVCVCVCVCVVCVCVCMYTHAGFKLRVSEALLWV